MRCEICEHAKVFSADGIYCVQYGMIIRNGHECTLPGAKKKEDPPVPQTPEEKIGGPQDEPQTL